MGGLQFVERAVEELDASRDDAHVVAERVSGLDMLVRIAPQDNTLGFNILFGAGPEKLYHSYMVFGAEETRVGALIEGRKYYVRIRAYTNAGGTVHVSKWSGAKPVKAK